MTSDQKVTGFVAVMTLALIIVFVFLGSRPVSADKLISQTAISSDILVNNKVTRRGSSDAPITLVEFADFQCPACARFHTILNQLASDYPDQLQIVFRHYPLSQHQNAPGASLAAEAAGAQGKFWEMHDALYQSQLDWSVAPDPQPIFTELAEDLGLNQEQFAQDLKNQAFGEKIAQDSADGDTVNVQATPTFFLNGRQVAEKGYNYEGMKSIIDYLLSQNQS